MEKYSKATKDFFESMGNIQPPKDEQDKVRNIFRAAKLVSHPENLPKALIAYGLTKESAQITEDIHPLKLRDFLLKEYQVEWLDWVPEVLDDTLLKEQKSDIISNKAQALRICLTTDTPWREWHIFENVGKAFNHQVPNFGLLQPLSLGECEIALRTMEGLRDEDLQEEVIIYIAARAFTENYVYLPEEWEVSIAQDHLDNMIYDFGLKMKTKDSWEKIKDKDLLDKKFREDDAVHRQLANLAVVQQYIREQDGSYNRSASE